MTFVALLLAFAAGNVTPTREETSVTILYEDKGCSWPGTSTSVTEVNYPVFMETNTTEHLASYNACASHAPRPRLVTPRTDMFFRGPDLARIPDPEKIRILPRKYEKKLRKCPKKLRKYAKKLRKYEKKLWVWIPNEPVSLLSSLFHLMVFVTRKIWNKLFLHMAPVPCFLATATMVFMIQGASTSTWSLVSVVAVTFVLTTWFPSLSYGEGDAGGKGGPNENPKDYVFFPKKSTIAGKIACMLDASGSMKAGYWQGCRWGSRDEPRPNFKLLKKAMEFLWGFYPQTEAIIYGPTESQSPETKKVMKKYSDLKSIEPKWGTYSYRLRNIPKEANVYVMVGDGALNDPGNWKTIVKNHITEGTFSKATHFCMVFACGTQECHKNRLLADMRMALTEGGVAAEVLVFEGDDVLNSSYCLVDILKPIVSNVKDFSHVPSGWLQVSDMFAFHPRMTPNVLGNYLKKSQPRIFYSLVDKMKEMARRSGVADILVEDPVWARIHKALLAGSKDDPHLYKEWMNEFKASLPQGPHRDILEQLYKNAVAEEGHAKTMEALSKIDPKLIKGYLVGPKDTVTGAEVIAAIRDPTLLLPLLKKFRKGMKFTPRTGEEVIADLPGMPVLNTDAEEVTPEMCRSMFQMFFAQWTTATLSPTSVWITAMYFLTKGKTADSEIVDMVKGSLFGDEAYTMSVLKFDEEGKVANPILGLPAITKMVKNLLRIHRDEMFPDTFGKTTDLPEEEKTGCKRIMSLIKTGCKRIMSLINRWDRSFRIQILGRELSKVSFTAPVEVEKPGDDDIVLGSKEALVPGTIVHFTEWTKGKKEPWINLPTVGRVVECVQVETHGKTIFHLVIQELDEPEPKDLLEIPVCFDSDGIPQGIRWSEHGLFSHVDSRSYILDDLKHLKLEIIFEPPLNKDGLLTEDSLSKAHAFAEEVNKFLKGLKVAGGTFGGKSYPEDHFAKKADAVPGLRKAVLGQVYSICSAKEEEKEMVWKDVPIPEPVIYSLLTGAPIGGLGLTPGENLKLKKIEELLKTEGQTEEHEIRHFEYTENKKQYTVVLSQAKIDEIRSYFDKKFWEELGEGLTALSRWATCAICYDNFNRCDMARPPCGHDLCKDCAKGLVPDYGPGDTIEDSRCTCPECRAPLPLTEIKPSAAENPYVIQAENWFKENPGGVPHGFRWGFCEVLSCACLFGQETACGEGEEAIDPKCESCRPKFGTKKCPQVAEHQPRRTEGAVT